MSLEYDANIAELSMSPSIIRESPFPEFQDEDDDDEDDEEDRESVEYDEEEHFDASPPEMNSFHDGESAISFDQSQLQFSYTNLMNDTATSEGVTSADSSFSEEMFEQKLSSINRSADENYR